MPAPANASYRRGTFAVTRVSIGALLAGAMAFVLAPSTSPAEGRLAEVAEPRPDVTAEGRSAVASSRDSAPSRQTISGEPPPTSTVPTNPDSVNTDAVDTDVVGTDAVDPETQQAEELEPVTLAFGGDIHFEGFLETKLAEDPTGMLAPVAAMMADADLAIANLETAVTDRGQPSDKAFNFRTEPSAFVALRAAGIDVVSVANNHGMDYGLEGLEDTLNHAEDAGFPVIGAGIDANQAYAPWSTEIKGHQIAIIGATQVLDSALRDLWTATDAKPGLASAKEEERLYAEVERAARSHDLVVVFLHWGIEGETCPAQRQLDLADGLVAAGANIVVGGHAHRVQGGGLHKGAVVHYGLGNFVFYRHDPPSTESGVLRVTILGDRVTNYEWVPAKLVDGVATKNDDPLALEAWEQLRSCTNLTSSTE